MLRRLYTFAMIGAQPLLRRKLRRRGRAEPGYLEHIDERFGRYAGSVEPGALWIHAVSLGETRAAAILVEQLRKLQPDIRILLTHGTATGRAEGERILRKGDMQAWLPWDVPKAVHGFLNHFRPRAGVLMETEVWPNLVAGCKARDIPLALANARFSEKSMKQTLRLARLARQTYGTLAAVWAQTDADAQRLAQVGATVKHVFGNLKFDATPDPVQLERGREWRDTLDRPVVMFASSREGEEEAFFQLLQSEDGLEGVQWLVVPRHPQRFEEVVQLAELHGLTVSRRTDWPDAPEDAQVWIGDSLGEMALYYGLADVALLGGSFAKLGGQNLIEAAACGCPVVMGPHTFNFAEAAELSLAAGAAQRVPDMREGVLAAVAWASDIERQLAGHRAALGFAAAHQGAARRTAEALLALVGR
ncbi:3-deoxy-D-manno-octulosonic acid transferase [Ramlibacter sp. PS4R-6]|uniref:3-deoxy-D-manno-octulosonic acid transferase n=1 Tax=Ramlibacter sp. PS4R-6 TaxID=3133438 RepID=UPI0030B5C771